MANYEKQEYDDDTSNIETGVRDVQLPDGINTIYDCRIQTLNLYADNIVELILQFRLQSYPDQLVDKYTFYSKQRHVIKDIDGAFFADPWNNNTIDLFADIYVDGHGKFTEQFKNKLGDLADNFGDNAPVVNDANIRRVASEILQIYKLRNP